jgi:hypothetical protein
MDDWDGDEVDAKVLALYVLERTPPITCSEQLASSKPAFLGAVCDNADPWISKTACPMEFKGIVISPESFRRPVGLCSRDELHSRGGVCIVQKSILTS